MFTEAGRNVMIRLELEGDRVVSVRFSRRGRSQSVRAHREVIVSAGAINSPQVLMLSGIGPADELEAHGIEVRHELPGVGRNLQDHPFITMMWEPVDDRIEVSHAVVKRSYQWCSYHGAVLWIGSEASITHVENHITISEPLAAFQWLKEQKVMKVHDVFRKKRILLL